MNSQEFAQNQVEQLDSWINETRVSIEQLMQREEYLLEQREKWTAIVGKYVTGQVVEERRLTLLPGGGFEPDGAA